MRFLFLLVFVHSLAMANGYMIEDKSAANSKLEVHEVEGIRYKDGVAFVSLSNAGKAFRMPANAEPMPCFENAWKSDMKVIIEKIEETKTVVNCKLYNGGVKQM